jgi:succinate dehydrogenase flavin-adding protein (antitoxin of CptAB toxin-antitoxin module)
MRELDALLLKFVDRNGGSLTDAETTAFEELLELPDPVLHAYLLKRSAPADASIAALIERIRAAAQP